MIKPILCSQLLTLHIESYLESLEPGENFKVIFGGHWSDHGGWFVLSEEDQDITRPLGFADESVDVIFTEHVLEHISFVDCISFMRESRRILKPAGVLRVISPMIERILTVSLDDEKSRQYIHNQLVGVYQKENEILKKELGLDGVREFRKTFMLNDIFREHGHKFLWSAELMVKVLRALGYRQAQVCEVGEGRNPDYCIERRRRGIYRGNDWGEDRLPGYVHDAESGVVEAIK